MFKLKKHYYRYEYKFKPDFWCYCIRYSYHRAVKTYPTIRNINHDIYDVRNEGINFKIRHKRNKAYLDAWNDFPISRSGKRSWKDYSKKHKQWE